MTETGEDRWTKYVDTLSKLLAAGAIVVAAWVAQRYEARANNLSLLNQREQSETQLRASMFQNLIEPIVGAKGGTDIAADREELLVELLTLNFHDHFEFKPLLMRVDERLASKHLDANRRELSSIARRVIDRQINMLTSVRGEIADREASVTTFYFSPSAPRGAKAETGPATSCEGRTCRVPSPDGKWLVTVTAWKIDLEAKTVAVSVTWRPAPARPLESVRGDSGARRGLDFQLTQFDFPLTDYTQLDDQHRFAIALFELGPDNGVMKIVWFPLGYVTERERPFDANSMKDNANVSR
jgi:hypothetical protein